MNINTVTLTGNLTRDPELRATKSGTQVLSLRIAVGEGQHNKKTDTWENYTNYFDCAIYGKRAETLNRKLAKGTKVAVTGRLHYRTWEKGGQKRSAVEIIANNVDVFNMPKRDEFSDTEGGTDQPERQGYATDLYDADVEF